VASFYNIGDRKTNIIHTKLRHRCSGLNADLFRVNLKNDPRCVYGHLFDDVIHFFLNVYFTNTLELLCLTILITLFPSLYNIYSLDVAKLVKNWILYCTNQCTNLFDKLVDILIIIPNRDIISTQFISFTPPSSFFSVKY
jgi:hypothetical protein